MSGRSDSPIRNWRNALLIALALTAAVFAPVAASGQPVTIAVVAGGSLPGIKDAELTAYLAQEMNAAGGASWHFEPAPAGKRNALNRIEWSFRPSGTAAGQVRTYGFTKALMQRLSGAHEFMNVEVTLYLDGAYQTRSMSLVKVTGGPADPDLAAEVTKDTRQLMAYPAMDTRVDSIGPGGRKLPAP